MKKLSRKLYIPFYGKVKRLEKGILIEYQTDPSILAQKSNKPLARLTNGGKTFEIIRPLELPRRWVHWLTNDAFCSLVGVFGDGYNGTNLYSNVFWGSYDDFRGRKWGSGRYIIVKTEQGILWSPTVAPLRNILPDRYTVKFYNGGVEITNVTGFDINLCANIKFCVPPGKDTVELWLVEIKNLSKKRRKLKMWIGSDAFIGSRIYAEWHHLVASLYNDSKVVNNVLFLFKGIHFDEGASYPTEEKAFLTVRGVPVKRFLKDEEYFLGNWMGKFGWEHPLSIESEFTEAAAGRARGVDVVGVAETGQIVLAPSGEPKDTVRFVVLCGAVLNNDKEAFEYIEKYGNWEKAQKACEEATRFWENINSKVTIVTADKELDLRYNNWWPLQNYLRKRWGNTGSLYHDYGKDILGWRDVWQDHLGWMYISPKDTEEFIKKALAGTRLDGSTASGLVLKSDGSYSFRNDPEKGVWCDHPFWPALTVYEYISNLGSPELLLEDGIPYIRDIYRKRATRKDPTWTPIGKIEFEKDRNGKIITGSVFEHLWIQLNSMFFAIDQKTGFLNHMRAGWDDALDQVFGANVPFTMATAWGMEMLSELLKYLDEEKLTLFAEFSKLIVGKKALKLSVKKKLEILEEFTNKVDRGFSTKKLKIEKDLLIEDMLAKARFLKELVNQKAWEPKGKFYIGYFDRYGNPIDYFKSRKNFKLHLAPQTFALLSRTVPGDWADDLIKSTFEKLEDKKCKGLRLCTPYERFYENVGRKSRFAPGTKEHSAKFVHMALMFMAGCLFYKKPNEAIRVWEGIAPYGIPDTVLKTPNIWIPEYYISSDNPEPNRWNEGQYEPLTASPSWARKIFSDYLFGIRRKPDRTLVVEPVIPKGWGKKAPLKMTKHFGETKLHVEIHNPTGKAAWKVKELKVNNKPVKQWQIPESGSYNIKVVL